MIRSLILVFTLLVSAPGFSQDLACEAAFLPALDTYKTNLIEFLGMKGLFKLAKPARGEEADQLISYMSVITKAAQVEKYSNIFEESIAKYLACVQPAVQCSAGAEECFQNQSESLPESLKNEIHGVFSLEADLRKWMSEILVFLNTLMV